GEPLDEERVDDRGADEGALGLDVVQWYAPHRSVPLRERPVSSRHAPWLRQPRARLGEVLGIATPEKDAGPEQASLSAEKVALPLVLDEREQLLLRGPITDAALQLDGLAVGAAAQLSDAAQGGRRDAAPLALPLAPLVRLLPVAVGGVHHTCPPRGGG